MKATLIVGLPASGKSIFIEEIKDSYDAVYDDEFFKIEEETRENILISHPDFCIETVRNEVFKKLRDRGYDVEFIFYENNPEQCLSNAKRRKDKKVDGYIRLLSKVYDPPRVDREVWNGWAVHGAHCCIHHGCKYGDEDCPVVLKKIGGIKCEDCYAEEQRLLHNAEWNELKNFLEEHNDQLALRKMKEIEEKWD